MTGAQGWKSRQKLPSVPPLGEPQDISKLTPLSFEAGIVKIHWEAALLLSDSQIPEIQSGPLSTSATHAWLPTQGCCREPRAPHFC